VSHGYRSDLVDGYARQTLATGSHSEIEFSPVRSEPALGNPFDELWYEPSTVRVAGALLLVVVGVLLWAVA
jgi:hypothetical protein